MGVEVEVVFIVAVERVSGGRLRLKNYCARPTQRTLATNSCDFKKHRRFSPTHRPTIHQTMGCAESREKYNVADISAAQPTPIAVVVPGSKILAKPNTYGLREQLFRLREDYDIKDASGTVSFKILGKFISLRDRQTFSDPSGKKLCMLQRKLLTLFPTFILYSYTPAFAGQPSVDTDGDAPLYRFAEMKSVFFSLPARWTYSVYTKDNETPEPVGEISSICSLYAMGVLQDLNGVPMFKFTQKALIAGSTGGVAGTYDLEVAAGMDPVQAIAAAVACQQLVQDSQ